MIGSPDRSEMAETRRLDGLARALALEGKSGRGRIDFELLWRGAQGLLLAVAILALGAAAIDPARAEEPDAALVLTLMLLPYLGSMVHPGAPTEWEALRMPSRRALLASRLLRALPWHAAAGIAWALYAAVKAFAGGAAAGPGVTGLAVAAGLLPALLGVGLLWHRAGTDSPDLRRATRTLVYGLACLGALLAARWFAARQMERGKSEVAVGAVLLVTMGFLAWRGVVNAREWLRLRRLEPWRRTGPATVVAALAASSLATVSLLAGLAIALAPPLAVARAASWGPGFALVATAAAVLLAPALVVHALRRVETVQVADSPEPIGPPARNGSVRTGEAARDATGTETATKRGAVPGVLSDWNREPPVQPGGGWWRAGWVRQRMGETPLWRAWIAGLASDPPGKRLLTVFLLPFALLGRGLRYAYVARGLFIAFGAVILTLADKAVGVHWYPFLALVIPNLFAADPSERTWLYGRDLRAAHLHDLRSFLACCVALPLAAGALALPYGDPYWGPAALALFAATLLFRAGWRGYRRWNDRPGPAGTWVFLGLTGACVLSGLGIAVSSRWREFVLTNPYPLSAILAIVGAAGLVGHLATLSEERLLDEMRGAAADDEDDDD